MREQCGTCGNTYKNKHTLAVHKKKCKSRKNPEQNAARQEEASNSAHDSNDLLDFHIVRRPRSTRGAAKEMDGGNEALPYEEKELDAAEALGLLKFPCIEVIMDGLRDIISDINSASVDLWGGTEKCGNEAFLSEETELIHNDDGQRLVDCPENSAVMEPKWPKLDLKVSDSSDNPVSDDAQGGNNDASGSGMPRLKQTSLTEPMAREADREHEQKLDRERSSPGSKKLHRSVVMRPLPQ